MQLAHSVKLRLSRNAHHAVAPLRACVIRPNQVLRTAHQVDGMPSCAPDHTFTATQADVTRDAQHPDSLISTGRPPTPAVMRLGPRLEHLSAAEDAGLLQILARQLQLPEWFVQELLAFGAVHWCPVSPALTEARAAKMDPEHVDILSAQREALVSRFGRQADCAQ